MKKTLIIVILALFAVLAISTAAADSEFYFVPQDSAVPAYCNTTEVQLWVNATEPIQGGMVKIVYTFCCANITSYSPNETFFEDQMAVTANPGKLNVGFAHWVGSMPTDQSAGVYHLGNFTIHCCNETSDCITELLFTDECQLGRVSGTTIVAVPFTTKDGTFTCGGKLEYPVSDLNGPYNGTEGVTILFNGSGSYDPDGFIAKYEWDFGDGSNETGVSPTHTYAQNGTYNVTLTVTDNEGLTGTNTTTAMVDDTEPTANFSATPTSGLEPLSVEFTDASTSYDGITSWAWDFGDGTTNSTDQNPTHVYASEGTYNVSLTVCEEDGDSDTETKENCITVTSENQPPVSDPNGPYTGTEGVTITFNGSASNDPDGDIASYAWDFGDENTGTGVSHTHTYTQNGIYTVTLTVTDNEGLTDTNTTTATIADTKLVADFTGTPRSGPKPLTVNFTDTSTSDDGITSWEWDFGDGTANSTDQNPTHVYTTEGTYKVSLTVYESDGDNDTETKENYTTVTTVEPIYNVSITSTPTERTTAPDVNATYTLTITNNGNAKDTIELDITANEAYYSTLSEDNFSLDVGANATAYLYVKDPDAGTYNTTVRATSQAGTSVFDVATVETNVTTAGAPTADLLEVEDASEKSGTYVVVPVNVRNVRNGPVQGIRLTVDYSESVLTLTNVSRGDLTTSWTGLNLSEDRHTLILATDDSGDVIPDGSSGTIVLLNFSVIGSPGDTSPMNLSLIELSNPDGDVGIAPAKNGTFTVSRLGAITGRITYACNGTEIAGVVVNLTTEGIVVDTAVTNEIGYYTFTDVNPDRYNVNVSKPRFYDNWTEVTVTAGETTIADMMLRLKGDLKNDGIIADSGDVILMLRASVGDIPGDEQYDLNGNGVIADAGDVVLLLRASIGDIILW